MKKFFTLVCSLILIQPAFAVNDTVSDNENDTRIFDPRLQTEIVFETTLSENNICKWKRYPPYFDTASNSLVLRNQPASYGRKLLRGASFVIGAQSLSMGFGNLLPGDFTNWASGPGVHRQNFINAFTKPPVFDKDPWYVNYVGHPWQGSYYYNAYRSQGAEIWQSALMSVGHSVLWEYVVESWFERPSIQDLIVTPVVGSLLGEAVHRGTISMSRNGFKWYEKVFVCVLNPMYALNNGFRVHTPVMN